MYDFDRILIPLFTVLENDRQRRTSVNIVFWNLDAIIIIY